eukprot:765967-Hanusia_phi.AAC.3
MVYHDILSIALQSLQASNLSLLSDMGKVLSVMESSIKDQEILSSILSEVSLLLRHPDIPEKNFSEIVMFLTDISHHLDSLKSSETMEDVRKIITDRISSTGNAALLLPYFSSLISLSYIGQRFIISQSDPQEISCYPSAEASISPLQHPLHTWKARSRCCLIAWRRAIEAGCPPPRQVVEVFSSLIAGMKDKGNRPWMMEENKFLRSLSLSSSSPAPIEQTCHFVFATNILVRAASFLDVRSRFRRPFARFATAETCQADHLAQKVLAAGESPGASESGNVEVFVAELDEERTRVYLCEAAEKLVDMYLNSSQCSFFEEDTDDR